MPDDGIVGIARVQVAPELLHQLGARLLVVVLGRKVEDLGKRLGAAAHHLQGGVDNTFEIHWVAFFRFSKGRRSGGSARAWARIRARRTRSGT
ncbi:hypothetical protein D3C86_2020230 [compost metagenome]